MKAHQANKSPNPISPQDPHKPNPQQLNFIQKAYQLVNNPIHSELIHWSNSGQTFIIQDIEKFEQNILPLYFRHNHYQSFVRQLNMYDFHKIRNGEYYCDNKSEFRHEEFVKGNVDAIGHIRRKGFQARVSTKNRIKIKTKNIEKQKQKQNKNNRNNKYFKVEVNVRKNTNKRNYGQVKRKNDGDSSFMPQEDKLSIENQLESQVQRRKQKFSQKSQKYPKLIQNPQKQSQQDQPCSSNSQQNSFFFQLPPQPENPNLYNQNHHKNHQQLQAIFSQILHELQTKNSQFFHSKKCINSAIELAELVKSQWLEHCQRISDSEDIRNMKTIYYRVKKEIKANRIDAEDSKEQNQLNILSNNHIPSPSSSKQNPNPIPQTPTSENYQKFEYTIEEQDAIIDSILRTEIRSTLICITSETFITSNRHKKIDTLIGI